MGGPWDGSQWDEDWPANSWGATYGPVEHGPPGGSVGRELATAVPGPLLLAAAGGAVAATALGLLVLLVGGVVVAVGLGALVLLAAAMLVTAVVRGAR